MVTGRAGPTSLMHASCPTLCPHIIERYIDLKVLSGFDKSRKAHLIQDRKVDFAYYVAKLGVAVIS
jgi:hypothetical protein